MTRYARGRAFEWKVRKHYERNGYFVVRSAGSKGKADLVALKKQTCYVADSSIPRAYAEVLLIQCKIRGSKKSDIHFSKPRNQWIVVDKEARELKVLADSVGAQAVWAVRKGHRGMELIEL